MNLTIGVNNEDFDDIAYLERFRFHYDSEAANCLDVKQTHLQLLYKKFHSTVRDLTT